MFAPLSRAFVLAVLDLVVLDLVVLDLAVLDANRNVQRLIMAYVPLRLNGHLPTSSRAALGSHSLPWFFYVDSDTIWP